MRVPYKISQRQFRAKKKGWSSWIITFQDPKLKAEYKDTYFKSRDLAEATAKEIYKKKVNNKIVPKAKKKSVDNVYSKFMEKDIDPLYDSNQMSKDRYSRYVYVGELLKKHDLGKMICDEVRTSDVSDFYRYNKSKGRSRKTIQNHHSCLEKFFVWCQIQDYITGRPTVKKMVRGLFQNDSKSFDIESISEENIKLIQENIFDDTFSQLMFLMAIKTGMRAGEQLALTWSDIDFDNDVITINKNISEGEGTKADKLSENTAMIGRRIPLNPDLKKALLSWKMETKYSQDDKEVFIRYGKRFRAYGGAATSSCYNYEGQSARYDSLKFILHNAIKKSGARSITWHSLRHYVASKLILTDGDSKDNLKKISLFLGHQQIATTERVYAHVIALSNYQDAKTLDMVANL